MTGVGAADGKKAYASQIAHTHDRDLNITKLEALNVVVALHSFLIDKDRGAHILVECDNLAAVQALRWGRARNEILVECSRAAWMLQAVLDVTITFAHIVGINNRVADC